MPAEHPFVNTRIGRRTSIPAHASRASRRNLEGAAGRRQWRGSGGVHRRRPRPRRPRREGRRRGEGPHTTAARRRPGRDRHQPRPRVAGADPPRHRARAGGGDPRPLPGHQDLDRPADRRRLLLRLRLPRGRHGLRPRLRAHRGEDARARQGRRALHARGPHHRAGARALRGRAPGLQGRADRRPRRQHRRRDRLALHQRPVHRPLPRPARALDQAHQGLQAAVGRRRLLARGLRPPDAHAHLRHGLPLQGGPRGAPAAARGGPRARPPQARQGAGPVPVLRAQPRLAVLAAERDGHLERADQPVAARERRPRLPRGQDADPLRHRPLQDVRPLGRVPGEHVLHGGGGPLDGPEADELPGAHPALQRRAPLLPRPADPLLRAGPRAPPRAERHPARPAARPPHHPGRRPHLLHRGADPRRGQPLPGLRLRDLRHVRLRAAAGALHPAGEADRLRGDVGPRGDGAAERARPARRRVRPQRGRRRLLRAEDRPAHDRHDRPLVAAGHRPARLQHARALRAHLHGGRQRRPPAR